MKKVMRSILLALLLVALGCSGNTDPPRKLPMPGNPQETGGESMQLLATKPSDRQILLKRAFSAPRERVFAALTEPKQLLQWMKPADMTFESCEIDLRSGGSLRYLFKRATGRKIEVRGIFESVEPPARFAYNESYDFSPLKVHVASVLEESAGRTALTQTLTYPSLRERDEDFDGVVASSKKAFADLEEFLTKQKQQSSKLQ